MAIHDLIEALEEQRGVLEDTILEGDMDLTCGEVLACSQELDKLITAYLEAVSKKSA